jgi:hypothetical protein
MLQVEPTAVIAAHETSLLRFAHENRCCARGCASAKSLLHKHLLCDMHNGGLGLCVHCTLAYVGDV